MARAESFTDDGLCPSAQLIVLSAVALLAGVFDQLQNAIVVLVRGTKEMPAACRRARPDTARRVCGRSNWRNECG
jgi:hypothetical protein